MSRRSGFGLLEVMFSTAIFIVVVGSLVSVSRLAARNAVIAAHRTQAINLAQDGLEIVRQLRDSAWMAGGSGDDSSRWLNLPICESTIVSDIRERVTLGVDYAICWSDHRVDQNSEAIPVRRFGLIRLATSRGTDVHQIRLTGRDGRLDPGSPPIYTRVIRFEPVPTTNDACGATSGPKSGLQFLAPDEKALPTPGIVCTVSGYEAIHAVKVVSKVTWRDFDRDWEVNLDTLLTNWRSK